jgi:hypothetical protein
MAEAARGEYAEGQFTVTARRETLGRVAARRRAAASLWFVFLESLLSAAAGVGGTVRTLHH